MGDILEHEELTYIISHDLQEPVRMINSYVKLLEKKYGSGLDEEAREYIRYTVEGASRLKSMLDDLLHYSRLNRENFSRTKFKLSDAIDTVVKHLAKRYPARNFEVMYDSGKMPEISADRNQISTLFLNTIDNSIKFNRNPKVLVEIEVQEKDGRLFICIKDNGIGIDNQYHDKIFSVFQKLHGNAEYNGSGIGLALCRRIVENHDGKMWVESGTGNGSKFCIDLPFLT